MRKTQILINKHVYSGSSILDLSKTVMYEFWYDYVKPKYDESTKLCYIDTDSFNVHVKTDAFKTASNRPIQKTAEATSDLIGN